MAKAGHRQRTGTEQAERRQRSSRAQGERRKGAGRAKEEIKQREAEEAQLKGRPGKGYKKTGWKTFCNPCWREFFIDGVDKCPLCGRDTITFDVSLIANGFGF